MLLMTIMIITTVTMMIKSKTTEIIIAIPIITMVITIMPVTIII